MSSPIEFITRGVKIMAKRITKKSVTKATNKAKKTVVSPAAQKRNPRPGSITKNTKNRITTKKPTTNKSGMSKFKGKTYGPSGRVGSVAAARANAASKAKKVSRFGLPGKAIAIGTLLTAGLLSNKKKKDPTFGEAFKKARKEKGPMSTFTYKGKKYSTVTKEQVQKAGHSTLRSYLNAGGKKKKTGLTTKRRKTGGPPLRRRR